MEKSRRLDRLKSAVFAELDKIKAEVAAKGISVIDPNSKTPPSIRWSFHFSASVGVESPTEVSMFSFS